MNTVKNFTVIGILLWGVSILAGETEIHTLNWAGSAFKAICTRKIDTYKSFMLSKKDQKSLLAFIQSKGDGEKKNIHEIERMNIDEKLKVHEQWFANFWADLEKQGIKLEEMIEIRETGWSKLLFLDSDVITMNWLTVVAKFSAPKGDKGGTIDIMMKAVDFPGVGWRVHSFRSLGWEEEIQLSTLERYR